MVKFLALFAVILVAMTGAGPAHATEVLLNRAAPNLGIGVYAPDSLTWRSKVMTHPAAVTAQDRVWSGPDWFETEFGHPCDFNEDIIGKYGYSSGANYALEGGQLAVRTGAQGFSFGFGGIPNSKERPAVRLAGRWGKNRKDYVRLQMVLEQDVDESQWSFSTASPGGYNVSKTFKITGRGKQTFAEDVDLVRVLAFDFAFPIGFKIECQTPNVSLHLDSIKLAPASANIYFRKSFTLTEKPILAHASFDDFDTFELYVNGQLVSSGNRMYPQGKTRTVDLVPYLKVGSNTIAYRREFFTWENDQWDEFLFEGMAVSQKGDLTRILGDETWRCAYHAAVGWMNAGFDDSSWPPARLIDERTAGGIRIPYSTNLADGTIVPNGTEPHHMGLLDAAPSDHKYPVFDYTETPAFRLRLPAGLQGKFKVSGEVYKAGTDTLVERATPTFAVRGAFTVAVAKLRTQAVGPYRIIWQMTDLAGKTMDSRRDEMIIVGPIPQEKLPLAGFEQNLENRLERVIHIDCAQTPEKDEFVDHAGPWWKAQLDKGQVTTADGMTYRETGPDVYDHFSYRLHGLERGQPYMVEVLIPDNQDRAVYSVVMDTHPVAYFNNGGDGGQYAASGAARTGALYPLTYGLRKLRYIYYPTGGASSVAVQNGMSGRRGAASAINIYRIKGGLPALAVPASARLMGSHEERMTVAPALFGAENPIENSLQSAVNGHRDAWYHWYRILERKIAFLRFQGRNMSVEGIYMYFDTSYPRKRGPWTSNDDFDLPYLMIKMYRHNGIKPYLGVEYVADAAVGADEVDTVSERRMRLGEPTVQTVDRYGRQVGRAVWGNGNFLHPTTKKYFHGLLQEIYDRYHDAGPVEGLYLVSSGWWMPGFTVGAYDDLRVSEVGYGDYTASLFEQETGIKLHIEAKDQQRFQKRYALLMGQYKAKWLAWRATKTRDSILDIARLLQTHPQKWKLLVEPSPYQAGYPAGIPNPFKDPKSTAAQRAQGFAEFMNDIDMPLELYKNLPNVAIAPELPATGWRRRNVNESILPNYGLTSDPYTGQGVQQLKALAIGGALDEAQVPVALAPRWIYRSSGPGMYIPRGIEDNAMSDFVNVLAHGIPDTIIYSWVDVNMETAFGPQNRRFNKAFYVTPTNVTFTPLPAAQTKGIIAQTAPKATGSLYLRLINNTPYPLHGTISTGASTVKDLVYDTTLSPGLGAAPHTFAVSLLPNDIRLLVLTKAQGETLRCDFDYAPDIAAHVLTQAQDLLQQSDLANALPAARRTALTTAVARHDAFAAQSSLSQWEVLSITATAKPRPAGQ